MKAPLPRQRAYPPRKREQKLKRRRALTARYAPPCYDVRMIPPEERAKATLRAVTRFGQRHPHWPDAHALRREFPKLGCRATVQATLGRLRDLGFISLTGRGITARWEPTIFGFDLLGKPPFTPRLAKQRARQDAALLLAQPILRKHVIIPEGQHAPQALNLDVME